MRMGLYLLLAIIFASIVGTVVPQEQAMGQRSWLEAFFQWSDIYHSWWYITLLVLLTLNLAVCSFYRLKTARVNSCRKEPLLDMEQLTRLQVHRSFKLTGEIDEIRDKIIGILVKRRYVVRADFAQNYCRIGAQSGRFYVWGSFAVHFSFIVIVAGILTGSVGGFKGMINAPVGTSFNLSDVPSVNDRILKHDFLVKVDDFWIESYPDGTPSGFFSSLSILEHDKSVETAIIKVNHPLSYNGTKIYQVGYGNALQIQVTGPEKKIIYDGFLMEGKRFNIPGTDTGILVYLHEIPSDMNSGNYHNFRIVYMLFENDQQVGKGMADLGTFISLSPDEGTAIRFIQTMPYTGLLVKNGYPGNSPYLAGFLSCF